MSELITSLKEFFDSNAKEEIKSLWDEGRYLDNEQGFKVKDWMKSKQIHVEYEGKVYQFIFNTGKVWREPPTGVVTEMFEGEEFDLTNYIEDEGWLIRDEEGVDSLVYASDCKVL